MPARRVPRLSSLVGSLGAALVLAAAFAPAASPTAHAQDGMGSGSAMGQSAGRGPMMGQGPMMGGPMMGGPGGPSFAGYTDDGEVVVPGQTQICREASGAQTNRSFYSPTVINFNVFPPYGGTWGFYTGVGNLCRWQPR